MNGSNLYKECKRMLRKESVYCDGLAALLLEASSKAKIKRLQAEIAEIGSEELHHKDTSRMNNLSYYLDALK